MESLVILSLMTIFIMVLAAKGMILLPENKRAVVIRLGRFERVLEPGLNLVLPFIDVPHLVNLTVNMPEWQSLSGSELNEKVKSLVLSDPNINRDG